LSRHRSPSSSRHRRARSTRHDAAKNPPGRRWRGRRRKHDARMAPLGRRHRLARRRRWRHTDGSARSLSQVTADGEGGGVGSGTRTALPGRYPQVAADGEGGGGDAVDEQLIGSPSSSRHRRPRRRRRRGERTARRVAVLKPSPTTKDWRRRGGRTAVKREEGVAKLQGNRARPPIILVATHRDFGNTVCARICQRI
jgi:hypothetical protein